MGLFRALDEVERKEKRSAYMHKPTSVFLLPKRNHFDKFPPRIVSGSWVQAHAQPRDVWDVPGLFLCTIPLRPLNLKQLKLQVSQKTSGLRHPIIPTSKTPDVPENWREDGSQVTNPKNAAALSRGRTLLKIET